MCYPGSSALVTVRTSDPGDRFIWFSSFKVWWYFLFVLGFLCKSSGQFCFGDCLTGDQGDRFSWFLSLRSVYN